jgi:hypothetical protein
MQVLSTGITICFLTDESYSAKLVDLWKARGTKDYELDDVMLLKVGRHIKAKGPLWLAQFILI